MPTDWLKKQAKLNQLNGRMRKQLAGQQIS